MWQPIETAPKDGTKIILLPWADPESLFVSYWVSCDQRWANNDWSKITHWMPLPKAPEEESKKPKWVGAKIY